MSAPTPPPPAPAPSQPVLARAVHAITPGLVIIAATVLIAIRRIDSATGVAMIGVAGGYGAAAVTSNVGK